MDDREQATFNMGMGYLTRLHSLLYSCDNASMDLNSHLWFHSLMALLRELSTEMKEEEIKAFEEYGKEINTDIQRGMNKYKQKGSKLSSELYMKLHEFEMGLRKILKKSGLQMKMLDDPGKALM